VTVRNFTWHRSYPGQALTDSSEEVAGFTGTEEERREGAKVILVFGSWVGARNVICIYMQELRAVVKQLDNRLRCHYFSLRWMSFRQRLLLYL
jgi:hypothetical protein